MSVPNFSGLRSHPADHDSLVSQPPPSVCTSPEKTRLTQANLAAIQIWQSFIDEGEAQFLDRAKGWMGRADGFINDLFRKDGKTHLDDIRTHWNLERKLLNEVKKRIEGFEFETVEKSLREIAQSGPKDLKKRAQQLLKQLNSRGYDGGFLLGHLIRFVAKVPANSQHAKDLFHDADQTEIRYPGTLTPFMLYALIGELSPDPSLKADCEKKLATLKEGKSVGRLVVDLLRSTGTDDVVQMATMSAAMKIGSVARLATLDKLKSVGVTGYKAVGLGWGANIAAEGSALWAMGTVQESAYHDLEKSLDPKHLAKSLGSNMVMIGTLKPFSAVGGAVKARLSKAAEKMAEEFWKRKLGTEALAWSVQHAFGLGGMVASTQINQGLRLHDAPKGGFKESFVHDAFTYTKYGFAQRGFDNLLGKDFVRKNHELHQKIAQREVELIEAEKLKIKTYTHPLLHPLFQPMLALLGFGMAAIGDGPRERYDTLFIKFSKNLKKLEREGGTDIEGWIRIGKEFRLLVEAGDGFFGQEVFDAHRDKELLWERMDKAFSRLTLDQVGELIELHRKLSDANHIKQYEVDSLLDLIISGDSKDPRTHLIEERSASSKRFLEGIFHKRFEGRVDAKHENGKPKLVQLSKDQVIDGILCREGEVAFHENGALISGELASDQVVDGQRLPKGTIFFLHDQGKLDLAIPPRDFEIQGIVVEKDTAVYFFPDGRLDRGILAANTVVNGILLEAGTAVEFHANGKLKSGTIVDTFFTQALTAEERQVRFDENGQAISSQQDGPVSPRRGGVGLASFVGFGAGLATLLASEQARAADNWGDYINANRGFSGFLAGYVVGMFMGGFLSYLMLRTVSSRAKTEKEDWHSDWVIEQKMDRRSLPVDEAGWTKSDNVFTGRLTAPMEAQGIHCDAGLIHLYDNGSLAGANLLRDQEVPRSRHRLQGAGGTRVLFHPNGGLKKVTLGKAVKIDGIHHGKNAELFFDTEGNLLPEESTPGKKTKGGGGRDPAALIGFGAGLATLLASEPARASDNFTGLGATEVSLLMALVAAVGGGMIAKDLHSQWSKSPDRLKLDVVWRFKEGHAREGLLLKEQNVLGLEIPAGSGLRFDSDGQLVEIQLGAAKKLFGFSFQKLDRLRLNAALGLSEVTLAKDGTFQGHRYRAGDMLDFDAKVKLKGANLRSSQTIQGLEIHAHSHVEFFPDGKIDLAWLAKDQTIQGVSCAEGLVSFHANGRLKHAELSAEAEFDGILLSEGTRVHWNPEGVAIFSEKDLIRPKASKRD